jgi:hypothetical protein
VCSEADADVRLFAVVQPVIDQPDFQIGLVYSKYPFNEPKVSVIGNYLFGPVQGVGDISLDAVPSGILLKFLYADVDGYVPFHLQVFVVALLLMLDMVTRCAYHVLFSTDEHNANFATAHQKSKLTMRRSLLYRKISF